MDGGSHAEGDQEVAADFPEVSALLHPPPVNQHFAFPAVGFTKLDQCFRMAINAQNQRPPRDITVDKLGQLLRLADEMLIHWQHVR